jgi:WD40 repeat protein
MSDETGRDAGLDEERLADRVADLADRIARGDGLDVGSLDDECPGGSEAIGRLLPAIRLLSEFADDEPADGRLAWMAQPADVLGDFRLGREIGRGGIGVVYEARQISLGRRVAVKVLAQSSRLDPRQRRRFEIEAQAAAALQHPNIVPVIAYGHEGGVPYLAMRLIEGRNLAEVVHDLREQTGRGLPPREAAELARQAAEALDYAHRHDVLHRDLKPSNFLVDDDHRLWVADFGLARVRGDSDLTVTGDVIGTLRYLSPEQSRGRRGIVDVRSDVYALGATLYELLTLRPVFEGDDRAEILVRIVREEPRFSRKLHAAIPVDLTTIVLKALAKDPADRYATAGELAADLALFLADRPIRARPPTLASRAARWTRRRWKTVAAAGLMAAVLLMGLAAASLWSNARLRAINQQLQDEIGRSDRFAREAREQAGLSERHAHGAQIRLAAQAIDAGQAERAQEILRDIAAHAGREAPRSFSWRYLRRRALREVVVLVGPTPNFRHMTLSPDGTILATMDPSAGLVLRDAGTGVPVHPLAGGSEPIGKPAFSPDGSLVAAVQTTTDADATDGITVWEVASGRCLARVPTRRGHQGCRCGFLPGGTLVSFVFGGTVASTFLCQVWDLADDPAHPRLLEQFEKPPTADTDWNGGALLTREDGATVLLRDALTGKPVRAFRIEGAGQEITAAACSAGAAFVATVSGPSRQLTVWEGPTGKRLATHATPPGIDRIAFSPDGATIAAIDKRQGVSLIDRAGGAGPQIVSAPVDHPRLSKVAFSPDGTRLATALSRRSDEGQPSPVSLRETATGRTLAAFPGRSEAEEDLVFAPDGRSLFIASRSGVRVWRLSAGDADADRQPAGHKDEAWSLAFSPDGRVLASGSDDTESDPTVKLWDPATGRGIRAWSGGPGTVTSLAFSPDGRALASGHLESRGNVRIWDPATGRQLATLAGHTDRVRSVAFAPDGRLLASAGADGTVRLWDVASRREREVLTGHADTIHAIAFSPDGQTLASAGNDGDIRLWDRRSGDGPSSLAGVLHNRTNLMAVAFAPDGRTLAAADTLGSITVWAVEGSAPLRMIHGDGDEVRQLAFSPDGTALAAAGIRGLIRLWDPVTGQELLSLPPHRAQVNGLAFSPDGSILASAAHDGSVRLWRAEP